MKKFLLAAAIASVFAIPQSALAFCKDKVPAEFESAARALYLDGILKGNPDGSCTLEKGINRIEFAKLAMVATIGAEDVEEHKYATGIFPDLDNLVKKDQNLWFKNIAITAKKHNILKGDGNGNLRPSDPVNAAEAWVIILRAAGIKVADHSVWYIGAQNALKAQDIKVYEPGHRMTRGQVVELIHQVMNLNYHAMLDAAEKGSTSTGTPTPSTPASTPVSTPQPTPTPAPQQAGGGVVLPANNILSYKYFVENFESLPSANVAAQVRTFTEATNPHAYFDLVVYSAWGSWVHQRACEHDSSIVLNIGGLNANCAYTAQQWANTLQFSGGSWDQALSYAKQQKADVLIAIKCSTGEFSAQSCSAYRNAVSGYHQMQNRTTQEIIDNFGAGSCTSPGSYLPDGSYCAPRS